VQRGKKSAQEFFLELEIHCRIRLSYGRKICIDIYRVSRRMKALGLRDSYFRFFEMSIRCKTQWQEYFVESCASAVCSRCENKSITCYRLFAVRLSLRFTKRHGSYAALTKPVYAFAKAWALRSR
jgi:hypothetical protein